MTTSVPDSTANLIEEYIRDARLQGLTEETVDTYESNLIYTFEYLNCSPEDVGKDELKSLLYHLRNEKDGRRGRTDGLSHQTITGYFSALNSLYKYLIYEEYMDANPVPPFRERYVKKAVGREH